MQNGIKARSRAVSLSYQKRREHQARALGRKVSDLLSFGEVADLLGYSTQYLWHLRKQGRFTAKPHGIGRSKYYLRDEVLTATFGILNNRKQ